MVVGFGILIPIPEGLRKSRTLMESEVQNTPSFPSASDELTLYFKTIVRFVDCEFAME